MKLSNLEIQALERVFKLNLINSITGIKPANLIGTKSNTGLSNLGIFSSVVHLGSDPALLGFVLRPEGEVRRHTFENIKENGFYTINHIPVSNIEQAHFTSAKFEKDENEFDYCGFNEEYAKGFFAPFVQESVLKIGMKYCEEYFIARNATTMVVGEIERIIIENDDIVASNGYLDFEKAGIAGISGLNTYYSLKKEKSFPYARRNEIPVFKK